MPHPPRKHVHRCARRRAAKDQRADADGTVCGCFVIDMSVSGVAVSADIQPEIGMPLAVGACVGRVVRIFPEGFAVKFVEPQSRDDLERRVARPRAAARSTGEEPATRDAPRREDQRLAHAEA